MFKMKIIANRQLSQYNSDDKNINISKHIFLKKLFEKIYSGNFSTINNESIDIKKNGKTRRIDFQIEDIILGNKYNVYFDYSPRELRLQLRTYVVDREIIPGDIITICVSEDKGNCIIKIKSKSIYKYVLERKTVTDPRYRVFIDLPENDNNAGITVTNKTEEYLKKFNIYKTSKKIPFGKEDKIVMFNGYYFEKCNTKYIGVPYQENLKIDFFNEIEEIL